MFSRPSLPPMPYRLWLPDLGLYVKAATPRKGRFTGTRCADRAAVMPEPEARELARGLIRARGLIVELRPARGALS